MKKCTLLLSLLFISFLVFADYVEIGNGTGFEPAQGPFYHFYKSNHTQTLYFQEELGGMNTFTSLSFNLERMATAQQALPNFTVRILPVDVEQLTAGAFVDMSEAIEVFYSASYWLANDVGWFDIDIDDYDYDGATDLIVDIEFGQLEMYAPYDGYYRNFKTTTPGVTRMLIGYSDNTYPVNYSMSSDAYSNIRFNFFVVGAPESPFNPSPESEAHTVALNMELSWEYGDDTETYDLIFDTAYPPVAVVITDADAEGTGGTYSPETLEYQTTYYWRLIVKNSNRINTYGPIWNFTTLFSPVEEDFETNDFSAHDWQFAGGDWVIDDTEAYSAYHSATSGTVNAGTTRSLFVEKEVTDDGVISFAYRSILTWTSDYNFYINDELIDLPETSTWQYVTYPISIGNYTFKWEIISANSNDQIWVDYISFPPTIMYDNDLAMRTISGANISTAGNSEDYHITIKNIGNNDQSAYTVRLMQEGDVELASVEVTENLVAGETAEFDLTWDIPGDAVGGETYIWAEVIMDSDENPDNNIGDNFNVFIYAFGTYVMLNEDFESGSLPEGWTHELINGTTEWLYQSGGYSGNPGSAHTGSYNAFFYNSTGHIAQLITPAMNLGTANPGELRFWHTQKVWAGDQDELKVFYKNSPGGAWILLEHYTENIPGWTERIIELPNPSSTYYLGFEAIGNYGFGVCLDDILVNGNPTVYDNDLSADILTGPNQVNIGGSYVYNLTVRNVGNLAQNNYTVKLLTNTNSELASLDITNSIPPGDEVIHNFVWNVADDYPTGNSSIHAKVILEGDENPGNNQTCNLPILTYPAGYSEVSIGDGTEANNRLPICFQYNNSLTESIYFEDEMNSESTIGGIIESLTYYNNFQNQILNAPTHIWLGHTDLETLENGWIPSTELTLVFDSTVNYPSGENEIFINLETPFLYEGGNLVIMTHRPFEETNYPGFDDFYVTETVSHMDRTRYNRDNEAVYDPANPPEDSYSFEKYSNIKIIFTLGATSSIQGHVYGEDNTSITSAEILVEETGRITYTDASGFYLLDGVLPGTLTVTASAFGYEPSTSILEVEEEETITQDFNLTPLGVVAVSGKLVGSDLPDIGFADTAVILDGYQHYEVTTDANGDFIIQGVFINNTYTLQAAYEGYEALNMEVVVEGADLDLGTIIMPEITLPPGNIVATQNVAGTEVDLIWNTPGSGSTEFRYDDGTLNAYVGDANEGTNAIFGAVHMNSAGINSISWYLSGDYQNHATVNLYIFGLDAANMPDRDNLLYSTTQVPNVDDQWNEFEISLTVEATQGFYIAIGTPNLYLSIGLDDGVGSPYEFQSGTQIFSNNWTDVDEPWQDLGEFNPLYEKNIMIRGHGLDYGEVTRDTNILGLTTEINLRNLRSLESYNVYRFPLMYQNDPSNWDLIANEITDTLHTDITWSSLNQGNYRFAVTAVHTNGVESIASFSNIIEKTTDAGFENSQVPAVTRLSNNYPNPFNPSTTINFSLKQPERVSLQIFNIKGELINTLINSEMAGGNHQVVWEGYDNDKRPCASGIYFYKMKAGRYTSTKKMILMK